MDNTFSVQFKGNRKRMGLTQGEVAEMLCVSTQAISKWETGTSYPDLSLLPTIANLFGVSVDSLEYCRDTRILSEEQMSPLTPKAAKTKLKLLESIMSLTDQSG